MSEGEFDFDQLSRAADPAAHVARLDDTELSRLLRLAEGIMRGNQTNGGWPATVKWLCMFEGAKRFFGKARSTKHEALSTGQA